MSPSNSAAKKKIEPFKLRTLEYYDNQKVHGTDVYILVDNNTLY